MVSREELETILDYELGLIEFMTFDSKYPGNIKQNKELSRVLMEKYEEEFCELDRKQFMALCKLYREKHSLEDAYCKVCGKLCNVKSDYSFHETCSKECGRVIAAKKTSETYSKKSGDEIRMIKDKRAMTNLKRFGSITNLQSKEMIDKRIEKYGGNSNFCSKEVQEKIKRTNLEKYGVENVFASDVVKKKIKETNLKKYGKQNPGEVEEIKEKIAKTNLKRYGGTLMGSNLLKERIQKSNLEKYGTTYPQKLQVTKEKMKQTNLERSGYEAPMKNPETKEKSVETCMEKYGVAYNCLRPECREASGHIISKVNMKWKENIERLGYKVEFEKVISGHNSFDLYIPEKNIVIDVNPTITHQSTKIISTHFGNIPPKKSNTHLLKRKLAEDNGYDCMMIWDWDDEEKVLDIFKKKKNLNVNKCEVYPLWRKEEIKQFFTENCLQAGYDDEEITICLKHNYEVIQAMSFCRSRFDKRYEWELLCVCTKLGYNVSGGLERIFKTFVDIYHPKSIVARYDYSKLFTNIYNNLGFKSTAGIKPNRHWYNPVTKRHITALTLFKYGFNTLHGEKCKKDNEWIVDKQLMINAGYLEVYDCGSKKFVWYAE